MIHYPSRRDVVMMAAGLTAVSSSSMDPRAAFAKVERAPLEGRVVSKIDMILRAATGAGEVPGVVALAATDNDILYEGHFGRRRLRDGAAMTRDTVFRVASMVKLITSVAALQLVEQNKLQLDAPVPEVDPAVSSPKVLEGFTPEVCRGCARQRVRSPYGRPTPPASATGFGIPGPPNMPRRLNG